MIIYECKSFYKIDQKKLDEIREDLDKTAKVATLIDAQVVILGVVTQSSDLSDLFAVVADAAKNAKELGIGVHLALNGKLHLNGSVNETNRWEVRIEELQVDERHPEQEYFVGESPKQDSGFWYSQGCFNQDVLRRWEQEMGI